MFVLFTVPLHLLRNNDRICNLTLEDSGEQGVKRKTQRMDSPPPRFKGAASLGSPISPARPRDWSPIHKSIKAPSPPRWTEGNKSASSVVPPPRGAQIQGFSVRNALKALGAVADYIGVIGHSLKALVSRAEKCTNDPGIITILSESDNKVLLEMIETKLDDQAESATGIQQAKMFRDASAKTKLLLDQIVESIYKLNQEKRFYGLNIELIAMVTFGKDVPYIIKFIRNSLELEDVAPNKNNVNEIFETICEHHKKMRSKIETQTGGFQSTAGNIIQNLQKENTSFGLQSSSSSDQRMPGHRTAQGNEWQSEYTKNQSTKEISSNWDSRKKLPGNDDVNYSGQSNYSGDRWPQQPQPQAKFESNIHHNNPPHTIPTRGPPPRGPPPRGSPPRGPPPRGPPRDPPPRGPPPKDPPPRGPPPRGPPPRGPPPRGPPPRCPSPPRGPPPPRVPPPPMLQSTHSYSSQGTSAKSFHSSPFGEAKPFPVPYSSDIQPTQRSKHLGEPKPFPVPYSTDIQRTQMNKHLGEAKPFPVPFSTDIQMTQRNKNPGYQQISTETYSREKYHSSENESMQSSPSGSNTQNYPRSGSQNYPSFSDGHTNYNPQVNTNQFPESNSNTYPNVSYKGSSSHYQQDPGHYPPPPPPVDGNNKPPTHQYQHPPPPQPGPSNRSSYDAPPPPQQSGGQQSGGQSNHQRYAGRSDPWY